MARRTTPLAQRAQGFFDMLAEEHRPVVKGEPKRIPLAQIRPDFDQPRRVLPDDLYRALQAGQIRPEQAIAALVQRAEDGDLVAQLVLGRDEEDSKNTSLWALAASIRRVGLRQPPTVYVLPDAERERPGETEGLRYRIAEGERRYWAHHLLVLRGHEAFAEMPCLVEKMPDDPLLVRARQVAENAMRRGLSAIARARAFAEVKRAIEREFLGTKVPEKSTGSHNEREFPGTRVPEKSAKQRGRPRLMVTSHDLDDLVAQQVGAVTGRPVTGRLVRNYLRLLTLPAEVQEIADAGHLPEKLLRHLFKLSDRPDLQREIVRKAVAERLSAREVQTLVKDLVQHSAPADQVVRQPVRYTPQDRLRRFTRVGLRIREQMQREEGGEDAFYYDLLTTEEYQDVCEQLLDLHRWLSSVVERLQNATDMGLSLPARSRYADDDVHES